MISEMLKEDITRPHKVYQVPHHAYYYTTCIVLYLTVVEPLCATMRFLQVVPNGTPTQTPSATVLPISSGLLAQALPV